MEGNTNAKMGNMRNIYAILALAWMFVLGPLAFIGIGEFFNLWSVLTTPSADDWFGNVLVVILFFGFYFGGIVLFMQLAERK